MSESNAVLADVGEIKRPAFSPGILKRFEAKFSKAVACWEWAASKRPNGYGQFAFEGTVTYAHRVAYRIYVGAIPDGMYVCHRCDNPSCVNPDHLFLGTAADNMLDAKTKGRLSGHHDHRGNGNPRAKLDASMVAAIMAAVSSGQTQAAVAREYGVGPTAISRIMLGKSWTRL